MVYKTFYPHCSCGDPTRTNDLWVMSPTSYHCSTPRFNYNRCPDCECKGRNNILNDKFIASFF